MQGPVSHPCTYFGAVRGVSLLGSWPSPEFPGQRPFPHFGSHPLWATGCLSFPKLGSSLCGDWAPPQCVSWPWARGIAIVLVGPRWRFVPPPV